MCSEGSEYRSARWSGRVAKRWSGRVPSSKSSYIKTIYPYALDHTPTSNFPLPLDSLSSIAFNFVFGVIFKDFSVFLGQKSPHFCI